MSILMGDILNAIESEMRALVLQSRALSLQSNLWPEGLAPDAVCLTVDVEWAHPVVLADLVSLFDSAGVAGTFFVTHDGVELPGHERGLHPNFRRNGDSYRAMRAQLPAGAAEPSDEEIYAFILKRTRSFAPEATGLRSHCLHSETTMHWQFKAFGMQYDCNPRMPFMCGLRPIRLLHDVLAIPTYYADQLDLHVPATGFALEGLRLEQPGLKVLDFHPNMVYLNASSDDHYQSTRSFYHDPERLLAARNPGRGIRTLLLELLDEIAAGRVRTVTAGEINRRWRTLPGSIG
jgi:hypothetical protein